MRWTRQRRCEADSAGRVCPVSDVPCARRRRRRVRQNRVVLAPVAGVKSAEVFVSPTGRDKTFNPPMTVTRRIRRRGERDISRKAIARGMLECLRLYLYAHVRFLSCNFAHEIAGAARTRHSLLPLFRGTHANL